MIQSIIRFFYKKDVDKYLKQVDDLLSEAKSVCKKEYVTYERYSISSPAFLHAMQPVFSCRAVVSWLKTRQDEIYTVIKMGDVANIQNYVGRALAIDAMLKDLENFEHAYAELLADVEDRKNGTNG